MRKIDWWLSAGVVAAMCLAVCSILRLPVADPSVPFVVASRPSMLKGARVVSAAPCGRAGAFAGLCHPVAGHPNGIERATQ